MERRRFPRLDARLDAELTYLADETQSTVTRDLTTSNVSVGGICLSTNSPLEAGAFVGLAIRLPQGGDPVSLFAEVVWCEKRSDGNYDVGLRFLSAAEGAVEELARYLDPQVH